MPARIYRPSKSAMQSGRAKTREWVLEFEPKAAKQLDPLMGWTGSTDTDGQVRLRFPGVDQAKAFARRHGLTFVLEPPEERTISPKSYADNFRFDRVQ